MSINFDASLVAVQAFANVVLLRFVGDGRFHEEQLVVGVQRHLVLPLPARVLLLFVGDGRLHDGEVVVEPQRHLVLPFPARVLQEEEVQCRQAPEAFHPPAFAKRECSPSWPLPP